MSDLVWNFIHVHGVTRYGIIFFLLQDDCKISTTEKLKRKQRKLKQKEKKRSFKRAKYSKLKEDNTSLENSNKILESKVKKTNEALISKSKDIEKLKSIGRHYKALSDKLVKRISPEQGSEVILGEGKFGICKLKQFTASGSRCYVAAKEYVFANTRLKDIIYEVQIVQQLSHQCFPFVFGICTHNNLQIVFELCSSPESQPIT